jgi:hypothetical protein
MPRGIYTRCEIIEWDMMMNCNRKATATSWLHEPYYTERKYFPLCGSHANWLNREESDYELDYDVWMNKYANL